MPSGWLAKTVWALRLVPSLRHFLRQHPYDAVLTFLWLPTVLAALSLSRQQSCPLLVWSVQSDLGQGFRWSWDGWLRRWLVRAVLPKRVDHFVVPSHGIQQRTQQLLSMPSEKLTVIPNSIDLARITELARAQDDCVPKQRKARIVTVGRLHPAKGMDVLLKAVAIAKQTATDLECYILGDGPERAGLMRLASKLGLNGCVCFAGYTCNPYAWLATADMFVSASWWETFGVAIAEAMALGLPVIATATDGAQDIISDGVDGILVPVGDAQALADSITDLVRNPSLRQRLGEKAQRKSQRFDAPLIAQSYTGLLERLLRRHGGHGESVAGSPLGLGAL